MLYEPPKTKQCILIGAAAVFLAVFLAVAIPLLYKKKTIQAPSVNLVDTKWQKVQKQSQRLDKIREVSGMKNYTSEEIEQQSKKLDELRNQIVK